MSYLESLRGGAITEALRLVKDNWQNVFTGLGTSRDKTQYGSFVGLNQISDAELSALYHQNDTAQRIVATRPKEMLRRGFTVRVEDDPDLSSEIGAALRDLRVTKKLRNAMIWGRLYGGCALIIGADDGRPAELPLNEEAVKTVRWLHVVDRRYLAPEKYYTDPIKDEFFGEPETYTVMPTRAEGVLTTVHRSRLLLFGGVHTADDERDRLGGWDYSVLMPVYEALRQFNDVWGAASNLMTDASQGVFKIQGLMGMIAGGQKEELQTRMQLVDMARSVARSILLDADGGEDFRREGSSFTDAYNMLDKFMLRLAAAAEMPVTILMGQSPAGMNATGESDFRWFYDSIAAAQEQDLKPEIERLVRIVLQAKDGPTGGKEPENWSIEFLPLWQPTEKERADLRKIVADTDKLYIDAEVVLPEEIARSRFRSDGWSAETEIDLDVREQVLASELAEPETAFADPVEGEEKETTGGKVVLAPTDIAIVVTVNEARKSQGLPDWRDPDEGSLTVAEFKARKETEGAAVGEAVGGAAAEEINPETESEQPLVTQEMQRAFTGPIPDEAEEEEAENSEPSDET